MEIQEQKRAAAEYAASLIEAGMIVGLGSGTTSDLFTRALGERVRSGLQCIGVPTSEETARLALSVGIPLSTLEQHSRLDLTVDGADEVDPRLNLIKGLGGALLREKIVGRAADRYVIIVDERKRVSRLGGRAPIPVEIVTFGWMTTRLYLEKLGFSCELRGDDTPFLTDGSNFILDCHASSDLDLSDPGTGGSIKGVTGVVEHGLFLGMATTIVVGTASGDVEVLSRPTSS